MGNRFLFSSFSSQKSAQSNSPWVLGPRVIGKLITLTSENGLTMNTMTKLQWGDTVMPGAEVQRARTLLCILEKWLHLFGLFPPFLNKGTGLGYLYSGSKYWDSATLLTRVISVSQIRSLVCGNHTGWGQTEGWCHNTASAEKLWSLLWLTIPRQQVFDQWGCPLKLLDRRCGAAI